MQTVKFSIGNNGVDFQGYLHDDLSNIWKSYDRRPAVIIFPGGAYKAHSLREEDPVTIPLLAAGYQVFVLTYSVLDQIRTSAPEEEAALCVKLLKEKADEFHIDPDRIAVLGFSAGGHLAASIACHWKKFGPEARPDAAVLCYPVITTGKYAHRESSNNITCHNDALLGYYSLETQVTDDTVPCFIWHTGEDEAVNVRNSRMFYSALLDHHVPAELHVYEKGVHGLSMGHLETGPEMVNIQTWITLAVNWLNERWNFRL